MNSPCVLPLGVQCCGIFVTEYIRFFRKAFKNLCVFVFPMELSECLVLGHQVKFVLNAVINPACGLLRQKYFWKDPNCFVTQMRKSAQGQSKTPASVPAIH